MAPTVSIGSAAEFSKLLSSSSVVVADFYADWCGPCKTIAPIYESLATKYSKPNQVTFTKINVDNQRQISSQYGVRAMPTFLIFRSGRVIDTIQGADARKLTSSVENAVKLAGPMKPTYSSVGRTLGGTPPAGRSLQRPLNLKGYWDAIVTFLGLYFVSFFAFDAYGAAERSSFNIHRVAPRPQQKSGTAGGRTGAATMVGKKLGTLSDLSGGD